MVKPSLGRCPEVGHALLKAVGFAGRGLRICGFSEAQTGRAKPALTDGWYVAYRCKFAVVATSGLS